MRLRETHPRAQRKSQLWQHQIMRLREESNPESDDMAAAP
jgi:hypothetical protein